MKLLPDIEIDGHTISLQDPFVVDDYLVTEITMIRYVDLYDTCSINFYSGNYCVRFEFESFINIVKSSLNNYFNYFRDKITYMDDLGRHTAATDIFNNCTSNYEIIFNWFHDRLSIIDSENFNRLVAQSRINRGESYIDNIHLAVKFINYQKVDIYGNIERDIRVTAAETGRIVATTSTLDASACSRLTFYSNGQRIAEALDIREVDETPPLMTNDIDYSVFTVGPDNNQTKLEKDYIHDWNYKPEYIKHFMDGENKRTTLLLGAEIEVGGNDDMRDIAIKNLVVKKCIQIMNSSKSDKEDLIYSTHDGTVQIELDTMPCSLEFHKNKMNYKEMFKYLDEEGYKGHDCNTAGLHIHANRDYLGKTKLQQELVISKILYIIEKFNDNICIIARRNNDYSKFVGDRAKEDTALILFDKYKREGKRAALNLEHKNTIEFRMFKSTLKYETFILTLEFVKDIINFAKSVSIEEIENMNWNDLMKTFSKELQQYYVDRYNKMFKKQLCEDVYKKIEYLKKEIERKKKDVKLKVGGQLGILNNNREISKLQMELRKCEIKKNKIINKNKEFLDIFNNARRHQLESIGFVRPIFSSINPNINPNNNPNNNTNAFMREYYSTPVPF